MAAAPHDHAPGDGRHGEPQEISLDDVLAARSNGAGIVRRTPVLPSVVLRDAIGRPVWLKAENLQRTGSFKIRGAMHRVARLPAETRAVTAGSAGNHAQALALAASNAGLGCQIFVPSGAPISKINACAGHGADVIEGGASLSEAVAASRAAAAAGDGVAFCHPYDDRDVIAGQATLGLELADQLDDVATVVVPLGGGGLCAGVALALAALLPQVRVVGVQAAVCAPFTGDPPPSGPVDTLADGIAVKSPGSITAPIIDRFVDDVVTVDEGAIADAMLLLTERTKLLVEGAGAVGVAALLAGQVSASGPVCVVLSGGNVDLGQIPGLIRRHESAAGRRLSLFARIGDRPGGLARLLDVCAAVGANVIEVQHVREGLDLDVRETGLRASFEVRSPAHGAELVAAIETAGYHVSIERHPRDLPTGR